jgi:hypothetical protein
VKVFALTIKGNELGLCTLMQVDSAIVFSTTDPLTMLESPKQIPEFRQTWLDENVPPGDSWDDPDTGTQTVFAGYESVTVPAGTFEHCYKAVTEATPALLDTLKARLANGELTADEYREAAERARIVAVRWFAAGTGLVKEQMDAIDLTRELVEVTDPGRGEALPSEPDSVTEISQ